MGMNLKGASGNEFDTSAWGWRPIHALCMELNDALALDLCFDGWGYNDGAGFKSQAECDRLAEALEKHVRYWNEQFRKRSTSCGTKIVVDDAYRTDGKSILEFARFLRKCGGSFEIN